MTSLIFRRDIENPYFSTHDSQLYYHSHKLDDLVTKAYPHSSSKLTSPYLQLSTESSPQRSRSDKHKKSLPTLFTDYDLPNAALNKSKLPAIDMPISTLYTEGSQAATKSGSVPYLYWKNLDSSNTANTSRAPEQSSKIQVSQKVISARQKTNSSSFEDDPFAHKKLFGYLEYLENTDKPFLKETFIKKVKKVGSVSTKTDINTSNELRSYSIPKASESIKVVTNTKQIFTLTPKSSKKFTGSSEIGTKVSISVNPSKKNAGEARRDSIELSLAPKDKLPEGVGAKSKVMTTRGKIQTLPKLYHNNQEQLLFKALAQNLHELYSIFGHERKVHSVVEQLADNNARVVQLISAKAHKITDYDVTKLVQRFAMIEFSSEQHVSIPEKLEKNRLGIITVEPGVLKELQHFNEKVEMFVIEKKRNQLKQIEDGLIQSEENLQEILTKKTKDMSNKNRIKQFHEAKAVIEDRPKVGFYFTSDDPVTVVEGHQKVHGDLKYVKVKHLEHARGLKEVVSSWRKHTGK